MKYIKRFFNGWNWFEIIFLALLLIVPAVATIIFESSIIDCLSTTLYLFWALLVAKGESYAHIIGIPAIFLYAYVSYNAKFYGEVVITLLVLLPLTVGSFFAWLRNKDKDAKNTVIVANANKKEMLAVACSQLIMGIGYYFILQAFKTDFLLVSTFSVMTGVFATYLIMRRNQFSFPAYIINDMVLIILWSYLVLGGQFEYISILLMPIMMLISDTYGAWNWAMLKKSQKREINK